MSKLKKHWLEIIAVIIVVYVLYRMYVAVKSGIKIASILSNPVALITDLFATIKNWVSGFSTGGSSSQSFTVVNPDGSTTATASDGTQLTIQPQPSSGYGNPQFNWGY